MDKYGGVNKSEEAETSVRVWSCGRVVVRF